MSVGSPSTTRSHLTLDEGALDRDTAGLTDRHIREVVDEFYRRVRVDPVLGPVFERHVRDWDAHHARLTGFWSSALLHTGSYYGRPAEIHRVIQGLSGTDFDRWLLLFESTAKDVCTEEHAAAFLIRAQRMRVGMMMALDLK